MPRTACLLAVLFSLATAVAAGGCASPPERNAVPLKLVDAAEIDKAVGRKGQLWVTAPPGIGDVTGAAPAR